MVVWVGFKWFIVIIFFCVLINYFLVFKDFVKGVKREGESDNDGDYGNNDINLLLWGVVLFKNICLLYWGD